MSYTPTEWNTGDIISSEKLNKLEAGVEQAIELPDISGASDGDVLTVKEGTTESAIVPLQTITFDNQVQFSLLSDTDWELVEEGTVAMMTIDGASEEVTASEFSPGVVGFVNQSGIAIADIPAYGGILVTGPLSDGDHTVYLAVLTPTGQYEATWAAPNVTYNVYTLVYDEALDKTIVENGMEFASDVWNHKLCKLVVDQSQRHFDLMPICYANGSIYVFGIDPFDTITAYDTPEVNRLIVYQEPGEDHYVYWDFGD